MQPELNHNHATASMKVLLLVFAVLLVGALGYMVYQQNSEADTTDYSAAPAVTKTDNSTTTETTDSDDQDNSTVNTYRDAESTFSFDIPTEYFITEDKDLPTSSGWVYRLSLAQKASSEGVLEVLPVKVRRAQQGAPVVGPTLEEARDSAVELLAILDPVNLKNVKKFTNPNGVTMESFDGSVFGGRSYVTVATDSQNHFTIYIDTVGDEDLAKYKPLYDKIVQSFKII